MLKKQSSDNVRNKLFFLPKTWLNWVMSHFCEVKNLFHNTTGPGWQGLLLNYTFLIWTITLQIVFLVPELRGEHPSQTDHKSFNANVHVTHVTIRNTNANRKPPPIWRPKSSFIYTYIFCVWWPSEVALRGVSGRLTWQFQSVITVTPICQTGPDSQEEQRQIKPATHHTWMVFKDIELIGCLTKYPVWEIPSCLSSILPTFFNSPHFVLAVLITFSPDGGCASFVWVSNPSDIYVPCGKKKKWNFHNLKGK